MISDKAFNYAVYFPILPATANTYIQAKNTYYDMDFCPAYWDWLEREFQLGNIFSIDNIYDELVDSKKVKTPNISDNFGVSCINTYELLQKLEAKFVLAS